MTTRRVFKWVVVFLLVFSCGAFGYQVFGPLRPIPPHRGEGTFQDISRRMGIVNISGYSISLPKFDLGKPYQAEFNLADLPRLGSKNVGVYLAIDDPNLRLWGHGVTEQFRGSLRLEFLDSRGAPAAHSQGELREFVWGNWLGAHRLYQDDRSFFKPASGEEYRLKIAYTPDPALASFNGYAYLECGGHK